MMNGYHCAGWRLVLAATAVYTIISPCRDLGEFIPCDPALPSHSVPLQTDC